MNTDEYGPDLVTVEDDEGCQHQFEIIDAIETDEGRYVALLPYFENPEDAIEDDGELVILEGVSEDGADMLEPIEDDEMFDEIAGLFEERLEDYYEIDVLDGPEDDTNED